MHAHNTSLQRLLLPLPAPLSSLPGRLDGAHVRPRLLARGARPLRVRTAAVLCSLAALHSTATRAHNYNVVCAHRYGTTLGPGLRWTTALPNASTGRLRHYFKTHFCISAARKALFDAMNVTVLVLADNGADVFLNGRRILADSNADHDPT